MKLLSRPGQLVAAWHVALLALFAYGEPTLKPGIQYVNPLIGTADGGHVFAGATLPFGMAKAVADTDVDNQAGFASDSTLVTGFSHMHDSGTGGGSSLGNFPLFAHPSCPGDDLTKCNFTLSSRSTEWASGTPQASPGYFSVGLVNGVVAEMTTTEHTALYQFNFSNNDGPFSPLIEVEINDLSRSRSSGAAFVDPSTGRLSGNGTFNPSFGSGIYDLYFCADFSGASVRDTGVWTNKGPNTSVNNITIDGGSAGAFVRFNTPEDNSIIARVGVSFISIDQACSNAEKEIPHFDFQKTVSAAVNAWDAKLKAIQVDSSGIDDNLLQTFWSGVYRSMVSPQDYTGENPLWSSDLPYYDSYYCIWDLYRSVFPLMTILDPLTLKDMINSLISIYQNEGWLPDCRMSLCKGFTQGGSNADVVIGDAYVKGLPGINWDDAYKAVVQDAEVEPSDWSIQGRGDLESYKKLGYIPVNDDDKNGTGLQTRSISRTVEYAYNDFCIAQIAQGLGNDEDYKKYALRSANWRNLFLANQTSTINGVVVDDVAGFLQPKNVDGTWGYQDPAYCSPLLNPDSCYLNPGGSETYEGSIWLYTFYAPQDMGSLVSMLGGPDDFVKRLQFLHSSGLLYIGDEQAYLTVFQYHYAGRPGLSAKQSHAYTPSLFNNTEDGLPGNDDSGAMGSYVVLSMLGLWPVPGQNVYLITPPFFPEARVTNGVTGKTATVRNVNFDPGYKSIYIQSATLNGVPYTKNWISHDFYTEGGTLELVLGDQESDWGTAVKDLPPSLTPYGW